MSLDVARCPQEQPENRAENHGFRWDQVTVLNRESNSSNATLFSMLFLSDYGEEKVIIWGEYDLDASMPFTLLSF